MTMAAETMMLAFFFLAETKGNLAIDRYQFIQLYSLFPIFISHRFASVLIRFSSFASVFIAFSLVSPLPPPPSSLPIHTSRFATINFSMSYHIDSCPICDDTHFSHCSLCCGHALFTLNLYEFNKKN